jgi:hypothetical protein
MLEIFDLAPKDRLIAQLLVSQGILKPEQLKQAMAKTKESFFFSLAEILIGSGSVTLNRLESLLNDY